jgi:prepilin signal peptidase PulO-like enzyme (type II secretory pathway)
VSAQLAVAAWLLLWAGCCAALARKPLPQEIQLPFVNLFVPGAAVGIAATFLREPQSAFFEGTAAIMLTIAGAVDSRTGYLFDVLTLPCGAICAVAAIAAHTAPAAFATVLEIVGPLTLLAIFSRGTWLGWGDVKACIPLAIAFGPFEAPPALFLAALSGALSAYAARRGRGCTIPFGPHLACGATLTLAITPLAHRLEAFAR